MAAIHERNGNFRVMFRYHGKQCNFTLGKVSEAEAKAKADQVDYLLMRLSQGLLSVPPGIDPQELSRLGSDEAVLAIRGDGTRKVSRMNYLIEERFRSLADPNPYHEQPAEPKRWKGRKKGGTEL